MRRGWKILIGVLAAIVLLLVLNAVATDRETKQAETTARGGQLLDLTGGTLQVVDWGPRKTRPIVLIHCFTCAVDWWDDLVPRLSRRHRVVTIDLLGHGGSEKPTSGYSIENQADLVAQALDRLRVRDAEVVGHSLGGPVAVALAERSPQLVRKIVIVDSSPDSSYASLGFIGNLAFQPLIGPALWRVKPDFTIRDGLEVAFAPGFDVPDAFVEDVKRMTYDSYSKSHSGGDDYTEERSLDKRVRRLGLPTLVLAGAEEQIMDDPREVLAAYAAAGARTKLIPGAGHSPNVEKPAQTATLILAFGASPKQGRGNQARDAR